MLVDAAEGQGVPGPGGAVVVLGPPHLGRGGAHRDDGVDDVVAGNDVDDRIGRGGKFRQLPLAVGQDDRVRHLEPLDPAGMWVPQRRLDDGRTHDGHPHVPAVIRDHGLPHRLGEGVDIGPSERARPLGTCGDEFLLDPFDATAFGVLTGRQVPGLAVQLLRLLPQEGELFRGAGPGLNHRRHGERGLGLVGVVHVVGVGGLRDRSTPTPGRVGGGDVHVVRHPLQVSLLVGTGFAEAGQQRLGAEHIGPERSVDRWVEGDVPGTVDEHVDVTGQDRDLRKVPLDHLYPGGHEVLDRSGLGDHLLEDRFLQQRPHPVLGAE